MQKTNMMKHTVIMTAVNLIMRSVGLIFNSYLTEKVGSSGIGLFQLVMSVYSLTVTFSCAGIKLASSRISVEINTLKKNDIFKSLSICLNYAGICGATVGFTLFLFSDFIGKALISSPSTAFPLKILSVSLPFIAMSSALSGYFTAVEKVPQYSGIQMLEQGFKIFTVVIILNKTTYVSPEYACMAIVTGMTASEIFSFCLSYILKKFTINKKTDKPSVNLRKILRIAIPDAAGTCVRSILLTVEHLMIPKGFLKSGKNTSSSLAAYGNIHAMSLPLLLFPSAILTSLSALLIPNLAKYHDLNERKTIICIVKRNLKRTLFYSVFCSFIFWHFSQLFSELVYKTNEAAKYIKILSPLIPIMYTDIITDGMLKGLDQQFHSMKYNIIDSSLCVILVYFLLPRYSVRGYIFILYISEIINFILSIKRLINVCDFKIKGFQVHAIKIPRLFRLKKYLSAPAVCEYQAYRDRVKRNQAP
ncbi:MAG: oligosaccharide flippase family protein [Clostridia bacterium]|nr:oligosaccharide flippase family protein [Clostridia bacterium]